MVTNDISVVEMLSNTKEVLIVPGYGMAVSRAQGSVGVIARICRDNNVAVKSGIHPVIGRVPGQMNVLLAEAGVPHEWVLEMDKFFLSLVNLATAKPRVPMDCLRFDCARVSFRIVCPCFRHVWPVFSLLFLVPLEGHPQ